MMNNYTTGISPMHIARAEDLPYFDSPPIQFSYTSTAALNAGFYTWADTPQPLDTVRPIMPNALYYLRNISFIADIPEDEYMSATVNTPEFQLYLKGDSEAVLLREPLLVSRFFDQFDYRFWFKRGKVNEELLCSFNGMLLQTVGLIGVAQITLTAVISAQEITDENFIKIFTLHYPSVKGNT